MLAECCASAADAGPTLGWIEPTYTLKAYTYITSDDILSHRLQNNIQHKQNRNHHKHRVIKILVINIKNMLCILDSINTKFTLLKNNSLNT